MLEYMKIHRAIDCQSMCESIVAYGWEDTTATEYLEIKKDCLESYVKDLGLEAVLAILQRVIDNRETIHTNVYTDSEGCTYNSVKWKNGYTRADKLRDHLYKMWDTIVGVRL